MFYKFWLFIIVAIFSYAAQCSATGIELRRLELALQQGKYPHIKGAKVTVGKTPQTLLLASQEKQNINNPIDIRSATKSVTALLFGVDTAVLNSLVMQQPVSEIFPHLLQSHNANQVQLKSQVSVEDLFTMRSGLACDDWQPSSLGNEDKMYESANWAKFWGAQPISHQPGKLFSYCTGNVIVLGQVLHKLAGQSAEVLAYKALFKPMSIQHAKWQKTPTGNIDTGGHLQLGLLDMHKIGLLVLNQGRWQGQQLVTADWIQQITNVHTSIPERRETYGMLWWQTVIEHEDKPISMIYAHGNGGNFIVIVPTLDLVAAFTGDAYNSEQQFIPLRLLVDSVIPSVLAMPEEV